MDGAGDGVEADGVVLEEAVDEAGGTHLGCGKAAQMRTVDKSYRVAEQHGDVKLMRGEQHAFATLMRQLAEQSHQFIAVRHVEE